MKITKIEKVKHQLGFYDIHGDFLDKPITAIAILNTNRPLKGYFITSRFNSDIIRNRRHCIRRYNNTLDLAYICLLVLIDRGEIFLIKKSRRSKKHKKLLERLYNRFINPGNLLSFTDCDNILIKLLKKKNNNNDTKKDL